MRLQPRIYAMPPFPYGQASFGGRNVIPSNQDAVFAVFGQDPMPPMPPMPAQPALPPAPPPGSGPTPFPGTFELGLGVGGAAIAAVGWYAGGWLMTLLGAGLLTYAVMQYPYGELANRYNPFAGVGAPGYGRGFGH